MKTPNQFIKFCTLLLFISLMTGFVILKSGCQNRFYTKQNKFYTKVHPRDTIGFNLIYDEYAGAFDTLKVTNFPYYAVSEPIIPSTKMAMMVSPKDIHHLIHEDSLADDFIPSSGSVHPAIISNWLKERHEKRKNRKKGFKIELDDGSDEVQMMNSSKYRRGNIIKITTLDSLERDSL